MADNLEQELRDFDEMLSRVEKHDIPVPDALKEKIIDTGSKLKRPVPAYVKISAVAAIFMLLFFSAVLWVPGFAAYAADIPGLGTIVEWVRGDKGIEYAREHGYSNIDGVTVFKDDYNIKIDSIFFDEDRLSMKLAANGPLINKIMETHQPWINVLFMDFDLIGGSISNSGSDEALKNNIVIVYAEKTFIEGEVLRFLEKNPECINLRVALSLPQGFNEPDFKAEVEWIDVKVPFSKDKVLLSKSFRTDETITVKGNQFIDKVTLTPKKLTISPTRIRLDIGAELPDGFEFSDFINPRLIDEKGNKYQSEGLISSYTSTNGRALYFVPSVYYKIPSTLTFHFDGIRFNQIEGRSFTLKMDEQYPKIISYMGYEIIIDNVSYHDGLLSLNVTFPDQSVLHIQGLNAEGCAEKSWSVINDEFESGQSYSTEYHMKIDKRDEYECYFEFPGYLLPESGQIKFSLR